MVDTTHDPYRSEIRSVRQVPAQPVRQEVVVAPAVGERRVVTRRSFSPAGVLAVLAAIGLAVIGAVALARAGLDGPLDEPVVQVAGTSHTALLGLIELGAALVLLLTGLSRDRGAILFASIVFGTAALVAAIEPSVGGDALAIERSWAIALVVLFGVIALVAALAPSVWRATERVDTLA
jgi:hypothetical protein